LECGFLFGGLPRLLIFEISQRTSHGSMSTEPNPLVQDQQPEGNTAEATGKMPNVQVAKVRRIAVFI
jgi:hypothetical protein